jgi:hypothetical protein
MFKNNNSTKNALLMDSFFLQIVELTELMHFETGWN